MTLAVGSTVFKAIPNSFMGGIVGSSFLGRFSRTLELAKMLSQMGFQELTSGDLASRVKQAQVLVDSLGQLKGAAMKVGQILSLELDDYFPPEAIQILSTLQNQAQPAQELDLAKTMRQEFSEDIRREISDINLKPIAAASMGQVYRARYRDHSVVFKVQYPGLEDSIEDDLSLLKKAVTALCFLTGRKFDLEPLFEEIETVFKNETDYEQEAQSTKEFAKLFASHEWPDVPVVAPEVFDTASTKKILCLSYEEGLSLKDWISLKPSLQDRNQIGRTLLELFVLEFFHWGLVQTDPNPGNFLIRQKPRLQVVALDFGATKKYERDFRQAYLRIIKTLPDGDSAQILRLCAEFGLIDARESVEAQESFLALLKHGTQLFRSVPDQGSVDFHFADDFFLKENARLGRDLIQKLRYSSPPERLLFLHRKLGGIYALLRKLDARFDVRPYWERILKTAELP